LKQTLKFVQLNYHDLLDLFFQNINR